MGLVRTWRFWVVWVSLLAACSGSEKGSNNTDGSYSAPTSAASRRCVIATYVPAGMTVFPVEHECGQILTDPEGERHVGLRVPTAELAPSANATTVTIGGRSVMLSSTSDDPEATPDGTSILFWDGSTQVLAVMWGLDASEMDRVVAGLRVVDRSQWSAYDWGPASTAQSP